MSVAQLVGRLLPTPESRDANSIIIKFYIQFLNCIEKTNIKKKRPGMAHLKSKLDFRSHSDQKLFANWQLLHVSRSNLWRHRLIIRHATLTVIIEIVVYTWREHRELVFYIYLHSQEGTAVIYWAKFASIQNMWVHVQNGWPFWKSQISRRDKNCYNFLKEN